MLEGLLPNPENIPLHGDRITVMRIDAYGRHRRVIVEKPPQVLLETQLSAHVANLYKINNPDQIAEYERQQTMAKKVARNCHFWFPQNRSKMTAPGVTPERQAMLFFNQQIESNWKVLLSENDKITIFDEMDVG